MNFHLEEITAEHQSNAAEWRMALPQFSRYVLKGVEGVSIQHRYLVHDENLPASTEVRHHNRTSSAVSQSFHGGKEFQADRKSYA